MEQKIVNDMELEGKIMAIFLKILSISLVFSFGLMF